MYKSWKFILSNTLMTNHDRIILGAFGLFGLSVLCFRVFHDYNLSVACAEYTSTPRLGSSRNTFSTPRLRSSHTSSAHQIGFTLSSVYVLQKNQKNSAVPSSCEEDRALRKRAWSCCCKRIPRPRWSPFFFDRELQKLYAERNELLSALDGLN